MSSEKKLLIVPVFSWYRDVIWDHRRPVSWYIIYVHMRKLTSLHNKHNICIQGIVDSNKNVCILCIPTFRQKGRRKRSSLRLCERMWPLHVSINQSLRVIKGVTDEKPEYKMLQTSKFAVRTSWLCTLNDILGTNENLSLALGPFPEIGHLWEQNQHKLKLMQTDVNP